jgi:simple sugar transport system permease protein
MLLLEPRSENTALIQVATPVLAILATIIAGGVLFAVLGKDPLLATRVIFIDPLLDPYSRSELLVKAAPLVLIATGLAIGFRAGVWNIGAEGQYILGAIFGGATGLVFYDVSGIWLLPFMAAMGVIGGLLWAMIPALLKTRFNANEILVSLMLVYVAQHLLEALLFGPLKDPDGFNWAESRLFHDSATLPIILEGTRVHIGVIVAFIVAIFGFVLLEKHVIGFQIKLSGQAPRAAKFAGSSTSRVTIFCLGLSGALAGLAGLFEAAGPAGQLTPSFPSGYGFTAIIVAFLGRLNPLAILLAAGVMSLTYIGGELAQLPPLSLPAVAISVFQGMLLFFLLGFNLLASYRISWRKQATV